MKKQNAKHFGGYGTKKRRNAFIFDWGNENN
jgi:hypothetical protein